MWRPSSKWPGGRCRRKNAANAPIATLSSLGALPAAFGVVKSLMTRTWCRVSELVKIKPRIITAIRWSMRVWSLLILLAVILIAIQPDPNASSEPLPAGEIVELSLYGLSLVGLLLAWRWEGLGSFLTLVALLAFSLVFFIRRDFWIPFLLLPTGFPAVGFLFCWQQTRHKSKPG